MRRCWLILAIPGLLAGATATADSDALAKNRRQLEKWRADPEHAQRLQRDLRAFSSLSPERQEQMRHLDRDLYSLDPSKRKHLWRVLERYSAWLDQLRENEPAELARIEAAHGPAERLQVIREIRERQWVDRLPRTTREALLKLPEDQRPARIAQLRQEEQKLRSQWQRRSPFPRQKPARLSDLTPEIQAFVKDKLLPRLNQQEQGRLKWAEGKWPDYVYTILELSKKHPVLPPLPPPQVSATSYQALPPEAKRLVSHEEMKKKMRHSPQLKAAVGRWPDFALAYLDLLHHEKKTLKTPLGASRPGEFPKEIQEFVNRLLKPELSKSEADQMKEAEGKWPEYPKLLLELAHKHHLVVPGMSLPGPTDFWDGAQPDVRRPFPRDRDARPIP